MVQHDVRSKYDISVRDYNRGVRDMYRESQSRPRVLMCSPWFCSFSRKAVAKYNGWRMEDVWLDR